MATTRQNPIVRLLLVIVALVCSFFLVWVFGGKRLAASFIHENTQPWAVFRIPQTPVPLPGLEASLEADVVTICDKGTENWSDVLVQIDQGYLAALNQLKPGECKQIPVHDFATESWKRMPPPKDLQVTRVAVLATNPANGYSQKPLTDRKGLSSP